jgi:beta-galactosidase/beta-glucuronidase
LVDDHPRPLLRREWTSLDGRWAFAIDHDARLRAPADVTFDREILVPFAPEAPASGIGDTGMFRACWYRRSFTAPPVGDDGRLWLRFGAVDHEATVWVDGHRVAVHEAGSVRFGVDVTDVSRSQRPPAGRPHAEGAAREARRGDARRTRGLRFAIIRAWRTTRISPTASAS